MRAIFGLTMLGGIGLLGLAVWPGLLEVIVFGLPLILISLPLLGFWFLLLIGLGLRDIVSKPEPGGKRRWWGLTSVGIMFVTMGLLWFHVPQRIAFALCFSGFGELIDGAPAYKSHGEAISRRVGVYLIDRYGVDRRGGVFFRTATGPDGIGPDLTSYGFAFQANGQGSPFGNAHYKRRHVFGSWYAFSASDDW